MKILADENLYEPIIDFLKETKNEVFSIRDEGLSGITDEKLYKIACENEMLIITMDKDFTNILRFPPHKCDGIIVLKIYKKSVQETLQIFKKFFNNLKISDIKKNLCIITPDTIKIRKTK